MAKRQLPLFVVLDLVTAEAAPFSPTERLVAIVIAAHMDKHSGEAWPSVRRIALQTGLGQAAVYAATKTLCEGEAAIFERSSGGGRHDGGTYQTTRYRLRSALHHVEGSEPSTRRSAPPGGVEPSTRWKRTLHQVETTEEPIEQPREEPILPAAPAGAAIVPTKGRGGWVGQVLDRWPGTIAAGRVGKALRPCVERYGEASTLDGLARWLEAGNARFGPEVFARDAERWINGAGATTTEKATARGLAAVALIEGGLHRDR